MSKTHYKKLQNPDYLGAYSLDNGNGGYDDIVRTITTIKTENVVGPDGKREDCSVMRFAESETKPMILNSTNAKTLEKLFKSPYVEDWANRKIQIGVEKVKAFGDIVDALRIRKFPPREQGTAKCADCNEPIHPTERMTAPQVAAYSRRQYGLDLCADCVKKRVGAAKAATANDQETSDNDLPDSVNDQAAAAAPETEAADE